MYASTSASSMPRSRSTPGYMYLNAGVSSLPRRRKLIFSTAAPNILSLSAFGLPICTPRELRVLVLHVHAGQPRLLRHRRRPVGVEYHAAVAPFALGDDLHARLAARR